MVVLCAGHRKATRLESRVTQRDKVVLRLWICERKGSNTLSFEKPDDNDTILDESGQLRHRQLLGRLLWLDRPDIKNAVLSIAHPRRNSYHVMKSRLSVCWDI